MVKLDHINLSVKNLKESLNFYEDLFDFKIVEQSEHKGKPYAIIKNGESMLCLYEEDNDMLPGDSSAYKVYHFGLRVSDLDHWHNQLQRTQVNVHLEWDYPHSKSWYINDPTGHEIEVCYWHDDQIRFDT